MHQYTETLSSLITEFSLEEIFLPQEEVVIHRSDVNRPALALTGFFTLFEPDRIQIIGNSEEAFLAEMDETTRMERINAFMALQPVAVILTNSIPPTDDFCNAARQHNVPLLRTDMKTSAFMAALIASLALSLAPRITRHGVLVEVYGEGIFIHGDSAIGKSETAIELVKRGHRLIADDAVEIKKVSAKTLIGTAPPSIRHYSELRGIGIVDIRRIFGMGSVKDSERLDLVVHLEPYDPTKFYDRLGLDNEYFEIMDINIPMHTIPVRPGRNLAIIVEIAAMNNRQKKMGYNTAEEFNNAIMRQAETIRANRKTD